VFARGAICGFVILIVAIQAYRPTRDNPRVEERQTLENAVFVPSAVQQILVRSCNDCHSNQTHWPWYSNVAPVSWVIADHVMEGRRHLNFSEWLRPGVNDPAQYTKQRFISICRELKLGRMPLPSYEMLHPRARLSAAQVQTVCDWAEGPRAGRP
jgi:Haem-binding domain